MREFLWSGKSEGKTLSPIAWQTVCASLKAGGLGLNCLKTQNQGLLLKWILKLKTVAPTSLWYQVVTASLSIQSWRELPVLSHSCMSHLWETISKTCVMDEHVWSIYSSNSIIKIYFGTLVEFWLDIWTGDQPLSVSCPMLFRLALNKHVSVEEFLCFLRNDAVDLVSASTGY